MKAECEAYYSWAMKKGTEVTIDLIKYFPEKNVHMVRVTNLWKKPRWFNITWFNEITD